MLSIKNKIRKLSSLSELNELTEFISDCKTMLGKSLFDLTTYFRQSQVFFSFILD